MATKPPIIASRSPHTVSLDGTGKAAARATGKAPGGMARDVGGGKDSRAGGKATRCGAHGGSPIGAVKSQCATACSASRHSEGHIA